MPPYFFHLAFELYYPSPDSPVCHDYSVPPPNLDILSSDLLLLPTRHSLFADSQDSTSRQTPSSEVTQEISPLKDPASQHPHWTTNDKQGTDNDKPAPAAGSRSPVDGLPKHSDWRFGKVSVDAIDMASVDVDRSTPTTQAGGGLSVKGRFVPSSPKTAELGWGVVHLYRDTTETLELDRLSDEHSPTTSARGYATQVDSQDAFVYTDCTTLCILAVPSYLTPQDFLGWIGEKATEDISHFRLVKTGTTNKYMVLMKFRDAKRASMWQKAWNGKAFSSLEPENCHVVFIKSIQFHASGASQNPSTFPTMQNDPFRPAIRNIPTVSLGTGTPLTTKPAPPPTPSLVELPTCPVCLERMDDTTGLLTIFCQHVFHCACLQKWKGSGCPVCRYTQDPAAQHQVDYSESECKLCGSETNLWVCLICGHIGCGRYDEAHAFAHFEETGHSYAMDIATQHVWDYAGDGYVHRLLTNKSDGKLVELPPRHASVNRPGDEMVSRDKIENIGVEYTQLLTGQLESQRLYFQEQMERAADKAAKSCVAAESAAATAEEIQQQLTELRVANHTLMHSTLPELERDKERLERRSARFEATARSMTKQWHDEKAISESLMSRVTHLEKQLGDAALRNSELEEQNRDLTFFISGGERLREHGDEVVNGTVSVAEAKSKKGKAKR